jgi:L-amino acid N-acyltransferase YncA
MNINLKPLNQNHKEQIINIYNYYIENSFAAYLENSVPLIFDQFKDVRRLPSVSRSETTVLWALTITAIPCFPAFS